MKNYKSINFIKDNFNEKRSKRIILLISIIIFMIVMLIGKNGILDYKKNKEVIENNDNQKIESNNENIEEYVNFKDIKLAYNLIGKENINKISYDSNDIEIEGICIDLNVLETLRIKSKSNNFSIDSISKEGSKYLFKIKYSVGV